MRWMRRIPNRLSNHLSMFYPERAKIRRKLVKSAIMTLTTGIPIYSN
jgi:hypothetical protein